MVTTQDLIFSHPKLEEFKKQAALHENIIMEELWDAPKALLISILQQVTGKHIVILSGGTRESKLFDDSTYFSSKIPLEFPAWESLPSEEIPPSPDVVGDRYKILRTLQESREPIILITTLQSILQKLLPPQKLNSMHLLFKKGESLPFDEIPEYLEMMGYHKKGIAADKGEFAVRGGILDLYPVHSPDPFRIEFWEETIVSIRTYDPIGQTSIEKVDQILVTPAEEMELLAENQHLATLFDYLGPQTIVIFDEIALLEDKYISLKSMAGFSSRLFLKWEEFSEKIASLQKVYFTETPLEKISEVRVLGSARPQKIAFHSFDQQWEAVRLRAPFFSLYGSFCPENGTPADLLAGLAQTPDLSVLFLSQNQSEETHLKEMLTTPMEATWLRGYLSSGFYLPDPSLNVVVLPATEITHRYKIRRQKQRSHYHHVPNEMLAITPGEAVVHMNSGIGRYLGIEKRPNHLGIPTEFMLVEYADGAKLYVPMEQANLVSKYIGATDQVPELHTLGSTRWKRSREKTETAIVGYATDLLKMQAERTLKGGIVYPPDSDLMKQFEEEFPYQETVDQQAAIDQLKQDMQSNKTMERLVCGDVGYGKTEVAMRAAFKAVADGKRQVAILVPTTVLAMQHFETFSQRMQHFAVRIGILSRFCKKKEIEETLEGVKQGTIDILIGTHRIVSEDVTFKDLGLVIIDEEQRFGVRAKEHLKKIRSQVDCITLSATPIPRTLYMSLVGARDLSVIQTPPDDRLPIQSVVCTATEELIKNAILRELARDGQIYVIHNRVETLFGFADQIRTLVPDARIVVGHGQMGAEELDRVFHAFKSGEAHVLVATSIIENGIDIPNANTILIDRADRFGLADLYQMRGRVGRWNRKAFCYFLVPSAKELSEISRKRLSVLTQTSGHGGGMKIAMHDLELRGAGNILGTDQSGHVATIGFHLYCKLLKKTVASLQKQETPTFFREVKIEFPFDARLPENYVNEIELRMDLYQRFGDAETNEEVDTLVEEIRDRFGPLPESVLWLQHITKIRLFAARHHFTLLRLTRSLFLAEQTHGKDKITHKGILDSPKTPEALEKGVIAFLSKHFPLKK